MMDSSKQVYRELIQDQGRTLGGCLSKIAASYKSLSMQIKNEVLEPFMMFSDNFRVTIEVRRTLTQAVAKKSSDMLADLERQRAALVKSQQQYYQSYTKMLRSKQEIERAI